MIVCIFIFSSCTVTRQYSYLKNIQKDTTIRNFVSNDFESKIQPGDQLSIVVTSLSPAEDDLFNKAAVVSASPGMSGFAVDADGNVQLHRLGKVPVAGSTRRELESRLEKDLLPYMKEPIANVQYLNHKVTVLGAVGSPQVINMPEEQLNIFEILVKAGDITESGMKNRVMVIRDENKDKKVKLLDLENDKVFTSPWYYVKPNDIVYVPDDLETKTKIERRQNIQSTIALVASSASLLIIVVDRILR
ncbi:MAG: polysaccharide biosynthesis/export family protein [Ferruginibacter sp.]